MPLEQLRKIYYQEMEDLNLDANNLDYDLWDRHKPFLNQLDSISNSCVSVFDFYKKKHIYSSEKYTQTFGYLKEDMEFGNNDFFDSHHHEADLLSSLEAGIYFLRHFKKIDAAEIRNFKVFFDYRRKNSRGKYFRVIEQFQILELDNLGKMWLSLSVLDISPDQDLDLPFRSRVLNFKTGETYLFPHIDKDEILSFREKEILQLISQGLISKQIADKLCISFNTVNTHRQRIIEKLNVSNTFEALRYAASYGLI